MLEYPWNEKNNTFTWLSSLYNLFKATRGILFFVILQPYLLVISK